MTLPDQQRLRRVLAALSAAGFDDQEPFLADLVKAAWPDPPPVWLYEFDYPFTPTQEDRNYPTRERMQYVAARVRLNDPTTPVVAGHPYLTWGTVLYIWNPSMGYYSEASEGGNVFGFAAARRAVAGGLMIVTSHHAVGVVGIVTAGEPHRHLGAHRDPLLDAPYAWSEYADGIPEPKVGP